MNEQIFKSMNDSIAKMKINVDKLTHTLENHHTDFDTTLKSL